MYSLFRPLSPAGLVNDISNNTTILTYKYFVVLCLMGIRDQEIARIEKYAAGLGIKIKWEKYTRAIGAEADWQIDGTQITMYCWARQSKTAKILALVHELAHHMGWVYNDRKQDLKTNAALENDAERKRGDPPIPKEQRYLIWYTEHHDAKYQESIFKELGLKIPRWSSFQRAASTCGTTDNFILLANVRQLRY